MAAAPLNKAQLHPLVLMSVTDAIARHVSRSHTTPLIGGLLGQQTKDGPTVEVAFDVLLVPNSEAPAWKVDATFFEARLQQQQEVNKEPAPLELVGVWTLAPGEGSIETTLSNELPGILPEILRHCENPIVLAIHTDLLVDQMTSTKNNSSGVARMPFTVYEPIFSEPRLASMEVDPSKKAPIMPESFRQITWEMQTGEAEMIALEFVKSGSGNASRVRTGNLTSQNETTAPASSAESKDKGKATSAGKSMQSVMAKRELYTPEEEELLSFLTTRSNALGTLRARLSTVQRVLNAAVQDPHSADPEMMRAIKALVSRLPGIEEANREQNLPTEGDDQEELSPPLSGTQASSNATLSDANLVELLGTLGRSIQNTRELGGKFAVVDSARRDLRRRDPMLSGVSSMGSMMSDVDLMDLT